MESTWGNKILIVTFVVLLLIFGGEAVYYFVYLQNSKPLSTNQNLLPTLAPTKIPSIIINKPIPTLPSDPLINVFSSSTDYIDPYNLKSLGNISLFLKVGIATDSNLVTKYQGYVIKINKNKTNNNVQTDTTPFFSINLAKKKDSINSDVIFVFNEKELEIVTFLKDGKTVDSNNLTVGDFILIKETLNYLTKKLTYEITTL